MAVQQSLLLAERIRSGQVRGKDILKKFDEEVDNEEEEKFQQKKILSSLFSVERLRGEYLLVLLNPKETTQVVKRLKMRFQDVAEIYEQIAEIERNLNRIETETEMSSRKLRRVVKSIKIGEIEATALRRLRHPSRGKQLKDFV